LSADIRIRRKQQFGGGAELTVVAARAIEIRGALSGASSKASSMIGASRRQ
jgi:hypothetical protein